MERSAQKNGFLNLLALLAVGVAGFAAARYSNCLTGQIGSFYIGLGVLVALVSWFQMRLAERERLEKLELDELARSRGSESLFESKEAELFPARRAREQFERYFVPAFSVVLFLLQAGGAYMLLRWLGKTPAVPMRQPMVAMALFGLFALVLFILGKFSATLARLEDNRLLRPSAAYLLLGAYLSFVAALAIAAGEAGFPKTDSYVARALCILLGIIAAETLITLVLEIYRPRVKGRAVRPLYDSRLVGLLGQPEGLITTAAQALDYQFGFKVSETWFFRLLEQNLPLLALGQLAVLGLSTCVVFIEAGEQAVLERFGRTLAGGSVLGPGAHLKWPWPIDRVYRYRTEEIQTFDVGYAPDPQTAGLKTIVWSISHAKEDNFVVANRLTTTVSTNAEEGLSKAPPVSLLAVNVPVHYQITNVLAWAYNNKDAARLLRDVATGELVRYLVSVDLNEIMSRGRLQAAEALRERIQTAANARQLGVRILFVGLQGIHPPTKVAPDYEKVVSASQLALSNILAATAYAIQTNALAGGRAFAATNEAAALRQRLAVTWVARAALFTNQIPAYEAAPSVYRERAFFQALNRATANARKYLLLTTNTEDVVVFDLQDRIRRDLEDLMVPSPQPK